MIQQEATIVKNIEAAVTKSQDAFWNHHITYQHDCLYGHIDPAIRERIPEAAEENR